MDLFWCPKKCRDNDGLYIVESTVSRDSSSRSSDFGSHTIFDRDFRNF